MPIPCPRINEVAVEVLGSTAHGSTSRIYANEVAIEVLGKGCQHTNQVAIEILGNAGTKQIVYVPPSSQSSLLITPYQRQGRVNQAAVEVLGNTSGGGPLRVHGNVNQMRVEVLGPNHIGVPVNVNKMRVEVLGPAPQNFLPSPGNVNQAAVEVLGKILSFTFVNQVGTEVLGRTSPPNNYRVNQAAIEVLGPSLDCYFFELSWVGGGTMYLIGSIYTYNEFNTEDSSNLGLEDGEGVLEREG